MLMLVIPAFATDLVRTTGVWRVTGDGWMDSLGSRIQALGDLDRDGYADFGVGADNSEYGTVNYVWIFYGSSAGPSAATLLWDDEDGPASSFTAAGDFNGDGLEDLVAPSPDTSTYWSVYLGNGSTFDADPFGYTGHYRPDDATGGGGDVNGDGYDDVAFYGYDDGMSVYFGGETDTREQWNHAPFDNSGYFGYARDLTGDFDGDGYDDVLAGDPGLESGGNKAYVFAGSAGGPSSDPSLILSEGGVPGLGVSVSAGDVDGDGFDDAAVACEDSAASDNVYVYYGGPSGLDTSSPWESGDTGANAVTLHADLQGDGFADLVIGSGGNTEGRVWVYAGASDGLAAVKDQEFYGTVEGVELGLIMDTPGDVDGDGAEDLLFGTPKYSVRSTDHEGAAWLAYGIGVDTDGDGVSDAVDCAAEDASVHPGADEHCDGIDEDCDGAADEDAVDASSWHPDADGDGFGDATLGSASCEAPVGGIADASDCDDTRTDVYPGAEEHCDAADEDCDGAVDEDPVDGATWYTDEDGDGYGQDPTVACEAPQGGTDRAGDCDDGDAAVAPSAAEACNEIDDDCDGEIDDPACEGERRGEGSGGCGCAAGTSGGVGPLLALLALTGAARRRRSPGGPSGRTRRPR